VTRTDPGDGRISVVIADDHRVVRAGLRLLLGQERRIDVLGEAGDAAHAIRLVAELHPDVLLLDINMPGRSGLDAIPDVLEASPHTRVVILTMQSGAGFAQTAMRAGARAFVLKDAADTELRQAVLAVAAGSTQLAPEPGARMVAGAPDSGGLTLREREVLRLIALGHTNGEMAELLGLSVRTVESHRAHIAMKVGLTTRAELVHKAIELHLMR
jgi:two-component system response regulator NreC